MEALASLLPCAKCAGHFRKLVPTMDTRSKAAFIRWTIDVHNVVNARLRKPVLSYPDALHSIADADHKTMGTGMLRASDLNGASMVSPAPAPTPAPTLSPAPLRPAAVPWGIWVVIGVLGLAVVGLAIATGIAYRTGTRRPPTKTL